MLETSCRLCGKKGHWKAECPERSKGSSSNNPAAPTLTAVPTAADSNLVDEFLSLEFLQLPEIHETAVDEPSLHSSFVTTVFLRGKRYNLSGVNGDNDNSKKGLSKQYQYTGNTSAPRSDMPNDAKPCIHTVRAPIPVSQLATDKLAMFASSETFGILDTGATKSVIGSALIADFLKVSIPKSESNFFDANVL